MFSNFDNDNSNFLLTQYFLCLYYSSDYVAGKELVSSNLLNKEEMKMNAITTYRRPQPGLLGHKVINEVFDNFFNDFPNHLKASTQGYPVADIYRDDDGSTVLEFALAGFKKKELAIDIQPDKRSITITGKANEENSKRQRIARRNFTRTYINYDDNLDLSGAKASFTDGLLTVRVPQRPEAKPVSISIE